jgi:hypothetical protein
MAMPLRTTLRPDAGPAATPRLVSAWRRATLARRLMLLIAAALALVAAMEIYNQIALNRERTAEV